MKKVKDMPKWASRDYFTSWEAACLYYDYEPSPKPDANAPKNLLDILTRLNKDIKEYKLQPEEIEIDNTLSKNDLVKLAKKYLGLSQITR